MLSGLLVIVASWLALFTILFGVGCMPAALLGRRIRSGEDILATFWLGFALVVAALQLWHLAAPIGPATLAAAALLGGIGLVAGRAAMATWWADLRRRVVASPTTSLIVGALGLLFLLWLANRAMAPIAPQGDSGFYHIGAVRWMQAEALLPGLGNVDGRFGFNNSLFLYLAMLDWPPGPPHFYHLGMPVLFVVFVAECALHLGHVLREGTRVAGRHLLGSLWIAGLVPYFFVEFGSTSTDTANLLIGFVLGLHLFRLVIERPAREDVAFHALVVVALATVGVTIKLSFAFLGFFACLAAGWRFLGARSEDFAAGFWSVVRADIAPLLGTIAVVAVVLGTWLARGVTMTGYVAYPSTTALSLDVDWRVPEQQVVGEADAIKVWARYPFETDQSWQEILDGWHWVGPWFFKTIERADVFTVPMLLFLGGLWVLARRTRSTPADRRAAGLFLAAPAVAFVLWFVTAPAERFGGAIFWLLGAGIWAVLFEQSTSGSFKRGVLRGASVFVPVTVLAAAVAGAVLSHGRYGWALFVTPGPERGFHPIPEAVVERHVSRSGVVHYVAVGTGPGSSKWVPGIRCWDAPLPCTKGYLPDLETRAPGTQRRGFRLAGER